MAAADDEEGSASGPGGAAAAEASPCSAEGVAPGAAEPTAAPRLEASEAELGMERNALLAPEPEPPCSPEGPALATPTKMCVGVEL